MNEHTPRYWKALLGVGMGAGMMIIGALIPAENNRLFWTLFTFGLLSSLIGVFQAYTASYGYLSNIYIIKMREKRMLFEAYKGATPEEKAAFGNIFPERDVEIVDFKKREYVRGTNIPVSVFQEFLLQSDKDNTVAQRNWKARGTEVAEDGLIVDYHWMWLAIYKKLVADGCVIENSHTGPHSEFWRGHAWKKLCDEWLEPVSIPELVD